MTVTITKNNVAQSIRQFIATNMLFTNGELPIGDDESFIDNSIVDSTGILELTLFVEETFRIEVRDDEVLPENFDSVNRLTDFVVRKQHAVA